MARAPLRAGMLGVGTIATAPYGFLPGMQKMKDDVVLTAVADPVIDRARAVAAEYGIPEAYATLEEMLDRADIDLVINLTPIPLHSATSKLILEAGMHMIIEKPIAATLEEADELIEIANTKSLKYVVAPPNMLYPDRIEAKRLIDSGSIGQPCFARVRSSHGGPASGAWPLDPTWFYQEGSGPLLDMGVYGIHEITGILGPAKRVVAFSGITEKTRTVRGGPFAGKQIDVTTDDNTLLMLDFGNSTFAVVDGTFNVNAVKSPKIEIFGRAGTINLYDQWYMTDPSMPTIEVFRLDAAPGIDGWITPRGFSKSANTELDRYGRAVLLKHLVDCINEDTHPVLSAEHARHALEIMIKSIESARAGQALDLRTTF